MVIVVCAGVLGERRREEDVHVAAGVEDDAGPLVVTTIKAQERKCVKAQAQPWGKTVVYKK